MSHFLYEGDPILLPTFEGGWERVFETSLGRLRQGTVVDTDDFRTASHSKGSSGSPTVLVPSHD